MVTIAFAGMYMPLCNANEIEDEELALLQCLTIEDAPKSSIISFTQPQDVFKLKPIVFGQFIDELFRSCTNHISPVI